jgi:hypothetical protein
MRSRLRAVFLASIGLTCLAVAPARATGFTDETAFRTALSNVFALENFDSFAANTAVSSLPSVGLSLGTLTTGTFPNVQSSAQVGGFNRTAPNVLSNNDAPALPGDGPLNFTPTAPNTLITAFGYWNVGGDDRTRITFFSSSGQVLETIDSPAVTNNFSFVGIINATGAARVEVSAIAGNGYLTIDDLQVRTAAVNGPEPGTFALAGSVVVALAIRRRLRK